MPVRRDLVVCREFEAEHDRYGLVQRPLDHGDLHARQGRKVVPGQLRRLQHDVSAVLRGRGADRQCEDERGECCDACHDGPPVTSLSVLEWPIAAPVRRGDRRCVIYCAPATLAGCRIVFTTWRPTWRPMSCPTRVEKR